MSFDDVLNWRYATKKFKNQKVSEDILSTILEIIRLTPSSFGLQPYHITVIEDQGLKARLKPLRNESQVLTCSHLLVFSADNDTEKSIHRLFSNGQGAKRHDLAPENLSQFKKKVFDFLREVGPEWPAKQAYIALGFAMMGCAQLKVDCCPMEVFSPADFKQILKLPENLEPKVLLAIGYRDGEDAPKTKVRLAHDELFDIR